MNGFNLILASLLVTGSLAIPAYGTVYNVNSGFETGDITGWTGNDPIKADVLTSHTSFNLGTTYSTPGSLYGNYFVRLTAGLGEDEYTTLSQTFFLKAGQQVAGYAAFDASDYSPFNDNAFVSVEDTSLISTTLWSQDVNGVGDNGNSPWTQWSFIAQAAGFYTLTFGVANNLDNGLDSVAIFDLPLIKQVPDGGSNLMLLGFALTSIYGFRRRTFKV